MRRTISIAGICQTRETFKNWFVNGGFCEHAERRNRGAMSRMGEADSQYDPFYELKKSTNIKGRLAVPNKAM
jgi:hypothetical protein